MMRLRRFSVCLLALQMGAAGIACAQVGVPPDPPSARDAAASTPPSAVLSLSVREALQGALTRAVAIQTQQLDVAQQRAQTEQASHEFLPQTVLSSQLERNSASATGAAATRGTTLSGALTSSWKLRSGTQLALTEGRQYDRNGQVAQVDGIDPAVNPTASNRVRSLSLTQPLLRGAGGDVVLLNERRAALALANARSGFLQTQRDVVLGGVTAYFGLEQAQQNVALAQAALKRAAEAKSINEELLGAGRISRIALLQSDADVAQAELALMQSRQAENVARRQLLRAIGRYDLDADHTEVRLTDTFTTYLPQETRDEGAVLRAALARRVDLELAAAAVKEGRYAVTEADDGLRNQLDLYVRRDRSGASVGGAATRGASLAVGLSFSMALDKSANRLASSAARVALRKAELSRTDLERTARTEVGDALKNIDFAFLQYRLAQRSAELARQRLDAEIEKTRAGRSSGTDLSLAQDALNQTLSQEVQARFAIFTAQLELQRVSGTVLEQWRVPSLAEDSALPAL